MSQTFINRLAEFFKHCMNVGGGTHNQKVNCGQGPLWIGWMRIKFEPYLANGKVLFTPTTNFKTFKNAVIYTIDDYKDYIGCSSIGHNNITEPIKKTKYLIDEINKIDNQSLINLIETNVSLFPDVNDYNNGWVLHENFNNDCKVGRKYKHLLKP